MYSVKYESTCVNDYLQAWLLYWLQMNRRTLHHLLVELRELRLRHLVAAFVASLLLGLFFLRQNNLHMINLRNLVQQADEQNKDITQRVTGLRNYIAAHMNTGMGEQGIYLEHSYERAYDAALQQAIDAGGSSAVIYQNAAQSCQAQFGKATYGAYTQCIADKVATSGAAPVKSPPPDLFRFNFISPAWSPDIAGFALLAAVFAAALLLGRAVLTAVIYLLLRAGR